MSVVLKLRNPAVGQGSPTPGPQIGTGPVGNRAAQQEVSGGQVSEASSAAPYCSPSLTLPPEPCSPTPTAAVGHYNQHQG